MEFETININELKPAEYNPRIMLPEQQEKLENNLKTFGLVDPIIIDLTDDNTVIGGHQRLEALKNINDEQKLHLLKLGDIGLVFKEIDFKIKDKNDQKALNLSLNKIQGDWDYAKRDELLIELSEENYNLELTGFELDEIDFDEVDENIENNIDNILNEGISEWDIETQYQETERRSSGLNDINLWVEEGDEVQIGSNTFIINDINSFFRCRFSDGELHFTLPTELKDQLITDNPTIFNRMDSIKQKHRKMREKL